MSPFHPIGGSRVARWSLCVAAAITIALPSIQARAQDRFSAEAFEPAPAVESSVLSVYSARPLPKGAYSVSLFGSYARRPLSIEDAAGGARLGDLIGSIDTLSLLGAVGLWDRLDVGLAVPIHRVSAGSAYAVTPPPAVQAARVDSSQAAFGDIRIVPRVALITRAAKSGVGLALLATVSLPTGDDKLYVGEPLRVEPRLALDFAHNGFLLSGNLGYLIRSKAQILGSTVDDMLRWGIGAEIPVVEHLSALLEAFGGLNLMAANFSDRDAPTEALVGVRYRHSGWTGQLGGGPGLIRGIAAPEWRLLLAVGYAHEPAEPETDRDHDGLLDSQDRCPDQPEDHDGFEDADGCPDPDNDRDGVPDASDRCPLQAEDHDGFEDADGCPDPDNDRDGVPDTSDRCPLQAEDIDGFEDTDGCPDPDNDQDGVLDASDRCPLQPGTAENAGCPAPEPPPKAEIKQGKIELHESFLFATNRAEIDPASQPLVDEIATLITGHPEIERVIVEGHTDDRGAPKHNRDLSRRRAETIVRALVTRGVAETRLSAEGYGPDRPLVPNTDDDSRAKNRRVEVRIERAP
jgi:outer membrane protein OmpA-like peptidoglycan-associated protein